MVTQEGKGGSIMLRKAYTKTGKSCRVTFDLPSEVGAKKAVLCGDFNNWDGKAHPMKRRKDGHFTATISLEAGRSYRFKYQLDNRRWENDWAADGYVPNDFGSDDSMVKV